MVVSKDDALDLILSDKNNNRHRPNEFKAGVKHLQAMGVKVILATEKSKEEGVNFALQTGILKKDHLHIGGSVIAGAEIDNLLYDNVTTTDGFVIKRDQLSVVYDMP